MQSSTDKSTETENNGAVEQDDSLGTGTDSNGNTEEPNQINELRKLLVGTDEVSDVLPEAVKESSRKGTELSEATLPIVEENIRESVVRNPRVLADALFPVIGPAIRKAISAALSSMVQSFNQTLEYSVSPKGLRWRLEAARTGRSFGEVVMLKTLQYRVEQVFLIHRETGLWLEHVAQNPQDTEDADMVSAMLTAISDFAHDSFKTAENATLDSFKISGLSVWIESSPDAYLAAAIRGNPPVELRNVFSSSIENIQYTFERELDSYEGNADVFEPTRPVLEDCLRFQAAETQPGGFFSPTNLVLGFLGLLLVLVIGFFAWDYWRWSNLLESVRNESGYVLTDYNRGWFTHQVSGLRDPLAGDAEKFLTESRYDKDDIEFRWRPYQDSDPAFVSKRIRSLLSLPDRNKITIENNVLRISGGVTPDLKAEAQKLAPLVGGITKVEFDGLDIESVISRVNSSVLAFKCGTRTVNNSKTRSDVFKNLVALSNVAKYNLEIASFSDGSGSPEIDKRMRQERADVIVDGLNVALKEGGKPNNINLKVVLSDVSNEDC